jgi:hypothetical protein
MGECCEVYSAKKTPHPLKEILIQSILDEERKSNETNDWEKEEW